MANREPINDMYEDDPMKIRSILAASVITTAATITALAQTAPPSGSPSAPGSAPMAPSSPSPSVAPPAQPGAPMQPGSTSSIGKTDTFFTATSAPSHWRAADAMGSAVYNRAEERIGDVEDLLIDAKGNIIAAVVGVGGFLGMGEHKVAISYSSFEMKRDANNIPRLIVAFDKEALKRAPEYRVADAKKI